MVEKRDRPAMGRRLPIRDGDSGEKGRKTKVDVTRNRSKREGEERSHSPTVEIKPLHRPIREGNGDLRSQNGDAVPILRITPGDLSLRPEGPEDGFCFGVVEPCYESRSWVVLSGVASDRLDLAKPASGRQLSFSRESTFPSKRKLTTRAPPASLLRDLFYLQEEC